MLFRLHTVRRKLTVLVASTLGVVFVVVVVLSWLLHRQLMDEVDNRVDEAKSGFQTELLDDMADQPLSLRVTAPPERIDSISELNGVSKGADFNGIIEHGCEKPGSTAPPAIVMAKGLAGKGSIVVCQPIDQAYLDDTKKKLSLELALLE